MLSGLSAELNEDSHVIDAFVLPPLQARSIIQLYISHGQFEKARQVWFGSLDFRNALRNDVILLADIYYGLREYEQAIKYYKIAHDNWNDSGNLRARLGIRLALCHLTIDPFDVRGWQYFTYRSVVWPSAGAISEYDKREQWRPGSNLGQRLVIYGDLGFGDSIMISKYYQSIQSLHPNMVIKVHERLKPALELNYPSLPFSSDPSANHDDLFIRDMSIPAILGCDELRNFGQKSRHVDPVFPLNLNKIGVCWNTSKANYGEWLKRSIEFEIFKKVFCSNYEFFSLAPPAMAPTGDEQIPSNLNMSLTGDMGAMAALIADMDLVITVDTSAAHLAGIMGKPVWTLLGSEPEQSIEIAVRM